MRTSPQKVSTTLGVIYFLLATCYHQIDAQNSSHIKDKLVLNNSTGNPSSTLSTCTEHSTEPQIKLKKFYFNSCIHAEFAAYLSIARKRKYIYFQNGQVDKLASNCDSPTIGIEPKLVIEFDCGRISFYISKESNSSVTYIKKIELSYELGFSVVSLTTLKPWIPQEIYSCAGYNASIPVGLNQTLILTNFSTTAVNEANSSEPYNLPAYCLLESEPDITELMLVIGLAIVCLALLVLLMFL